MSVDMGGGDGDSGPEVTLCLGRGAHERSQVVVCTCVAGPQSILSVRNSYYGPALTIIYRASHN